MLNKFNNTPVNNDLLNSISKVSDSNNKGKRSGLLIENTEKERNEYTFDSSVTSNKFKKTKNVKTENVIYIDSSDFIDTNISLSPRLKIVMIYLQHHLINNSYDPKFCNQTKEEKRTIVIDPKDYLRKRNFKDQKVYSKNMKDFENDIKSMKKINMEIEGVGFLLGIKGQDQLFTHISRDVRKRLSPLLGWENTKECWAKNTKEIHYKRYGLLVESFTIRDDGKWEIRFGDWVSAAYGSDTISYIKIADTVFNSQKVFGSKSNDNRMTMYLEMIKLYQIRNIKNQNQTGIKVSTLMKSINVSNATFRKYTARYKNQIMDILNILLEENFIINILDFQELTNKQIWDYVIRYRNLYDD